MSIFSVFTMAGGLAFFLFGMYVLSQGLERMAGNRLKKMLESMTSSLWKSIVLGAGITIAIQSSSALTVMLVGFVNSGIMELSQTVGIIMGSNIGTTLTAWLLSLTGIESTSFFVQLFKPTSFAPLMALAGIILIMISKSNKRRNIGEILVGFAILMFGMELMSGAVKPLADDPNFVGILTYFDNPILGVLTGTVFTGIIQSSAASVGILQALSMTGEITFGMALPIIFGQNIGTCVTSLISSIGASRSAKRVGVVHVLFNIIGTVVFMVVLYGVNLIFPFSFLDRVITPLGIAIVHSIFNVASTILLLPFGKLLVKLSTLIVRDDKRSESDFDLIDERLLVTPSIAVAECKEVTRQMFFIAQTQIFLAVEILGAYTAELDRAIEENEDRIDIFEDRLGTFLVRLNNDLTDEDRKQVAQMLRAIGDLERISDHAINILEASKELYEKQTPFSGFARADLAVMSNAILRIIDMTKTAFDTDDVPLAEAVESMEEVIDNLKEEILARHIDRLQRGICTIELGFVISNVLTNYERISDHCSNLGMGVIKANEDEMQMDYHHYGQDYRQQRRADFETKVAEFSAEYKLPPVSYDEIDNISFFDEQ